MAPVKGKSKKVETSKKTTASLQLKCASGSKVGKRKKTTNAADVETKKSVTRTKSQKRNEPTERTEAAAGDRISKKGRKGGKKIAEVLSEPEKVEDVAVEKRATRRRGKNVEEAKPVVAKKEKAVRVRKVKSNNAATEEKGDIGKNTSRKRRARVAKEVSVDDAVEEKVRPAKRAVKENAAEVKKSTTVKKEVKGNTKKPPVMRSGNRQLRKKQGASPSSKEEENKLVEQQEIEVSAPSSKRMRRTVVAVSDTKPKKGRKVATNAEEGSAVETNQLTKKKRKPVAAENVGRARRRAPVDNQLEQSLKVEDSAVTKEDVKSSAKKSPARAVVSHRSRKKEDARQFLEQDAASVGQAEKSLFANERVERSGVGSPAKNALELQAKIEEDIPSISERDATPQEQAEEFATTSKHVEGTATESSTEKALSVSNTPSVSERDATFEEQVDEPVTANERVESSGVGSLANNAVELLAKMEEDTPTISERDATSEEQAKESAIAIESIEGNARESPIESAIDLHNEEETPMISEQDSASEGQASGPDGCLLVRESFEKSMSRGEVGNTAATSTVPEVQGGASFSQEQQMEREEEKGDAVSEEVNHEPIEAHQYVDVDIPSNSEKTDHQNTVETVSEKVPLVTTTHHDHAAQAITSTLTSISHGEDEICEMGTSPELEVATPGLDESHGDDAGQTTIAPDLASTIHSESLPQQVRETDQALGGEEEEVVIVESVAEEEELIAVTAPSPAEAPLDDGNMSEEDSDTSSIDIVGTIQTLAPQLDNVRMKELDENEVIKEVDVSEKPVEEDHKLQSELADQVVETESSMVDREKLDGTKEADKETLLDPSNVVSCSASPAALADLCLHLSSPPIEKHDDCSHHDTSSSESGTEGQHSEQDVHERLMNEVRSRMTNFMGSYGDEQQPHSGCDKKEPSVEGCVVEEQWLSDEESDLQITDSIDAADNNVAKLFGTKAVEKMSIGSDVPKLSLEGEEVIDKKETLSSEKFLVDAREEFLTVKESNREEPLEKEKEGNCQLTVDSQESFIDVETLPEVASQKVMSEETNLNISLDSFQKSHQTAGGVANQGITGESSKPTHVAMSIQDRFAAQHKKFWEQGPNLQEHAERIKQRYLKHQSQVPGIFQRLSQTKDNSEKHVQSDKKVTIQRFEFSASASASTSSTSFTFDRHSAEEAAKPRLKGRFGMTSVHRGASLGVSARHPSRLPCLKMGVKALTKQTADEKRHLARFTTPRSEVKLSKRLQRLATPKGVVLKDAEDKAASSGTIRYTPHKHLPAFVDTTQMSQRQLEEAVKCGIVKPITGVSSFRQMLNEETKPKLNET